MDTPSERFRWLFQRFPAGGSRRLVVITGARQTGKTTLARSSWPELRYLNLDDIDLRGLLRQTSAEGWATAIGPAILDEAQKEPAVFDKVKFAFDAGAIDFSVLLGSSRILLLKQVRETLAGRAFLYDLWPLMPGELQHACGEEPARPLLDDLIVAREGIGSVLKEQPEVLLGREDDDRRSALEHLAQWGGMPELLHLDDATRREWLRSYQQTFLERDLADLTRMSDLEPFRALQKLCMMRTGCLLSYADLARDAGIGATTARRYLEYLRVSYQVVLLQPWTSSLTSDVVHAPKIYWIDLGLLRHATRRWGDLDGPLFETLVVAEIWKWCSTMGRDVDLRFYRTRSGMEVDLLVETEHGVLAMEIKNRRAAASKDLRGLRDVARKLGDRFLGGLVVQRGDRVALLDGDVPIWEVPVHRLLG